jgi:hypothetical protein
MRCLLWPNEDPPDEVAKELTRFKVRKEQFTRTDRYWVPKPLMQGNSFEVFQQSHTNLRSEDNEYRTLWTGEIQVTRWVIEFNSLEELVGFMGTYPALLHVTDKFGEPILTYAPHDDCY